MSVFSFANDFYPCLVCFSYLLVSFDSLKNMFPFKGIAHRDRSGLFGLICKVFIKGRGAEIFSEFRPPPPLAPVSILVRCKTKAPAGAVSAFNN